MTSSERFGWWLRHWRLEGGLTQDELGEKAGMDGPRVQKLERGTENPTVETIDRLSNALSRDVSLFFAPRHIGGVEDGITPGTSLLDRAILRAQTEAGSWRADVLEAIGVLTRALGRDIDRSQDPPAAQTPRR